MPIIGSKRQVKNKTADCTSGGLRYSDIKTKTKKDGSKRYVSKIKSKNGKQNEWIRASMIARKRLGLSHEFVLMKKNSALYKETSKIYYNE